MPEQLTINEREEKVLENLDESEEELHEKLKRQLLSEDLLESKKDTYIEIIFDERYDRMSLEEAKKEFMEVLMDDTHFRIRHLQDLKNKLMSESNASGEYAYALAKKLYKKEAIPAFMESYEVEEDLMKETQVLKHKTKTDIVVEKDIE